MVHTVVIATLAASGAKRLPDPLHVPRPTDTPAESATITDYRRVLLGG